MPDTVSNICELFADDAKLFRNVNVREHDPTLQNDLHSLTAWSSKWQLPFNYKKCKSLNIGPSNPFVDYKMGGLKLKQSKQEKDLGVIVDRELKFRAQAAAAIKTANSRLDFFLMAPTRSRGHHYRVVRKKASRIGSLMTGTAFQKKSDP